MARVSGAIAKSKRIEVLKDVLKRWGRIDKQHIDTNVAQILGVTTESLARCLYRDLEELVFHGLVQETAFTRDGEKIEEYDPEIHKNVRKEWSFIGFETHVIGFNLLEQMSGQLYVDPILSGAVSIVEGKLDACHNVFHFYFNIGNRFLSLRVEKDQIPVSVVVSRANKMINVFEVNELKKRISRRLIILKLPINSLSGFGKERIGHGMIQINEDQKLRIFDLESVNGTSFYKLTPAEAEDIRMKGSILEDMTMTKSWARAQQENLVKYPANGEEVSLPVVVEFSEKFRILAI